MTPIAGVGFLLVLGIRHYTLKRPSVKAPAKDVEAGKVATDAPLAEAEAAAPVAPAGALPLDVEKMAPETTNSDMREKRTGEKIA
jgi:hypothetical protein